MGNDTGTHDFGVLVGTFDSGKLRNEASRQLKELIENLQDQATQTCRSAKGKLTVDFDFNIDPTGLAKVHAEVTKKLPKPVRAGDAFFVTKGGLSRKNPKQQELPLREVPAAGDVLEAAHNQDVKGI